MRKALIAILALACFFAGSANAHDRYWSKPRAWCGWYMRTLYGGGPELNRARNWSFVGANAGKPQVGVIVVWRSHVGRIVGQNARGEWIVNSGNDSNAVRTRARSLAGAIAFRWPYPPRYRMAVR